MTATNVNRWKEVLDFIEFGRGRAAILEIVKIRRALGPDCDDDEAAGLAVRALDVCLPGSLLSAQDEVEEIRKLLHAQPRDGKVERLNSVAGDLLELHEGAVFPVAVGNHGALRVFKVGRGLECSNRPHDKEFISAVNRALSAARLSCNSRESQIVWTIEPDIESNKKIEDGSVGLAAFVAFCSFMRNHPVPPNVAFSGTISSGPNYNFDLSHTENMLRAKSESFDDLPLKYIWAPGVGIANIAGKAVISAHKTRGEVFRELFGVAEPLSRRAPEPSNHSIVIVAIVAIATLGVVALLVFTKPSPVAGQMPSSTAATATGQGGGSDPSPALSTSAATVASTVPTVVAKIDERPARVGLSTSRSTTKPNSSDSLQGAPSRAGLPDGGRSKNKVPKGEVIDVPEEPIP